MVMSSPHHHHQHQHHHGLSSSHSSTSYSSNSSSSSPFLHHNLTTTTMPSRTIDQVWHDITNPHSHHSSTPHPSPSIILQDFFTVNPHNPPVTPSVTPDHHRPILQLSLNSSYDFHYLDPQHRLFTTTPSTDTNTNTTINAQPTTDNKPSPFAELDMASSPLGFFPFGSKKRGVEQHHPTESSVEPAGGNCRQKRMMKNRESAARSRARKQAYTNELEVAVNSLTLENAKLRRMHDELRVAMAAQLPTKKTLLRTSTAPF